jgi:hypothetical protein
LLCWGERNLLQQQFLLITLLLLAGVAAAVFLHRALPVGVAVQGGCDLGRYRLLLLPHTPLRLVLAVHLER